MNAYKRLFPYTLSYIIPAAAALGILEGGIWCYSAFLFAFVFIPAVEVLLNENISNVSEFEEAELKHNPLFSFLLRGHVLTQYFVLAVFLSRISSDKMTAFEIAGAVLSTGVMLGGIGITAAHELIHRSSRFERNLGKALLLSTFYIHFFIEHIRGHHRMVGTPEDPASARIGEGFYAFWIRTVSGSYINAWRLEFARLSDKGFVHWSFRNQMIRFGIYTLLFTAAVIIIFGAAVLPYYFAACIIGFTLLELVNYIEHYGLSRRLKEDGKYEKVAVQHSWTSNYPLGRWILFELTRHADHHLNASREYQLLRNLEKNPVHPAGYPGMIIMALIPPLWRSVMDPRAKDVNNNFGKIPAL